MPRASMVAAQNDRSDWPALRARALEGVGYDLEVLVAAAGQADEDDSVGGQRLRHLHRVVDGVGRLQGRDYPLRLAEEGETLEGLRVSDGDVLRAAGLFVEGVLRPDA